MSRWRVELNFASMESGVQCVMMTGTVEMPLWSANNLDSPLSVSIPTDEPRIHCCWSNAVILHTFIAVGLTLSYSFGKHSLLCVASLVPSLSVPHIFIAYSMKYRKR